jgi:hypothetical protein
MYERHQLEAWLGFHFSRPSLLTPTNILDEANLDGAFSLFNLRC